MPVRVQLRRGTAAEWSSTNPVLAEGEPGFVTDENRFKIGDGVSTWNSLGYPPAPTKQRCLALSKTTLPATPTPPNFKLFQNGAFPPSFLGSDGTITDLCAPYHRTLSTQILSGGFRHIGHATAPPIVGTASYPAISTASLLESSWRVNLVAASATANAVAHLRTSAFSATQLNPYHVCVRWGPNTAATFIPATQVYLVGFDLNSGLMSGTLRPETHVRQGIYMGNATGTSTLIVLVNSGGDHTNRVELGANFPVPTHTNKELYDFEVLQGRVSPNRKIYWRVTRVSTGHRFEGVSAPPPWTSGVTFTNHVWTSSGATSAVVGVSFVQLTVQT